MHEGIHEDALRAILEGGAVCEVLVSRHGEQWGLAIRLRFKGKFRERETVSRPGR